MELEEEAGFSVDKKDMIGCVGEWELPLGALVLGSGHNKILENGN